MKLHMIDTKASANHGAWFQPNHPQLGTPLVDNHGKPLRVKLHGMECDAVKRARIKRDRANMGSNPESYITLEEHGDNVLEALIMDFEGFEEEDGGPLAPTPENKRRFINLSEDINRQILGFVMDRTNFLDPSATG